MHHFYYPEKDASIYKRQSTNNAGLDEILEIEKSYYAGSLREIARSLIRFDISTVSASIASGTISKNHKFYLNLTISEASEVPLAYTLYAYPVSQSWEMGVGTKYDGYTTTGVSWKYRDSADAGTLWVSGSTLLTGSLAVNTTGSVDGTGGGTWYTSSAASQSFSHNSANVRMDVSPLVHQWLSGSLPNEGFILKHSDSVETDNQDYGSLKFFSRDTNTIFPPTLEIAWDDSTFSTGSVTELSTGYEEYVVRVRNLRRSYKKDSKARFRLVARTRFPNASFTSGNPYEQVNYLPTSSYYSIVDTLTEKVIVPFSDYTKLSVDISGSYFDQWFSGIQPERFYKIKFKVETSDGLVDYIDNNEVFKLVR